MLVNSCGNAAIRTKNTISAAEIQNIGRRRSSSQASRAERARLLALRRSDAAGPPGRRWGRW